MAEWHAVEPQPPQVTIVDPNAPFGTTELLDSWRERWRPTRRQVTTSITGMALVALVVGLAWVASHRYLDRRADRAAVREVQLAFTRDHVELLSTDAHLFLSTTDVGIASTGGHPITLTAVEVVGMDPASATLALSVDGQGARFNLPPGTRCDVSALVAPPNTIRLRLRTYRGTSLTRTLVLPEADARRYAVTERARCGYPPPDFAFGASITGSEVAGRSLLVHYAFFNASEGELVVADLRTSAGLRASGVTLPLRLAPHARTTATVRVRVTDCHALIGAQTSPETSWAKLDVTVKNRFASASSSMELNSENDGILPTEVYAPDVFARWCATRTRSA